MSHRQDGGARPRPWVSLLALALTLVALAAGPHPETRAEVGPFGGGVALAAVWPTSLDTSGPNLGIEGDTGCQAAVEDAEQPQPNSPTKVDGHVGRARGLHGQRIAATRTHTAPVLRERDSLRVAPKTSPPIALR